MTQFDFEGLPINRRIQPRNLMADNLHNSPLKLYYQNKHKCSLEVNFAIIDLFITKLSIKKIGLYDITHNKVALPLLNAIIVSWGRDRSC